MSTNRDVRSGVLFVGDINVDLIFGGLASEPLLDREITCTRFEQTMGSTAVITAVHYAQMGGRAGVCGLCGRDRWGDYMVREMAAHGLDTTLVERSEAVATGVTVNLNHGNSRTQVTFPGAIAQFDGAPLLQPEYLTSWNHLHFSGVYQQTALLPRLSQILQSAKEAGMTVSLDTQWDQTERWNGLWSWAPYVDVLFVNEDEALSITQTADGDHALNRLAARFGVVAMKLGARGARACSGTESVYVPAPDVPVVDTTGAGDAFAAGFLYEYIHGVRELRTAVETGVTVGAFACTHAGGTSDRLRAATLRWFRDTYTARRRTV
jgi:sugar/nucleoside kinase (ribokinase family)